MLNKLLEDLVGSLSRNLYTPLMLTNFLISLQKLLKGKELEPVFNDDYDKEDQQDTGVRRGSIAAADINQQSLSLIHI